MQQAKSKKVFLKITLSQNADLNALLRAISELSNVQHVRQMTPSDLPTVFRPTDLLDWHRRLPLLDQAMVSGAISAMQAVRSSRPQRSQPEQPAVVQAGASLPAPGVPPARPVQTGQSQGAVPKKQAKPVPEPKQPKVKATSLKELEKEEAPLKKKIERCNTLIAACTQRIKASGVLPKELWEDKSYRVDPGDSRLPAEIARELEELLLYRESLFAGLKAQKKSKKDPVPGPSVQPK